MEAVARQHEEIDSLNQAYEGRFRVFKGIEANILADGSLDLQPEERRRFEFVVASPHALLRRQEDQTARMLAAVPQHYLNMTQKVLDLIERGLKVGG